MYARGILFGKMRYELGDHAVVRCPETGLEADVEFKVKGWIGGAYNAIGGFIKDSKTGKQLFELSGMWNEQMYIKDLSTGKKELFFDAAHSKPSFPKARPISEQHPRESQRLWESTTKAIKKADQKTATDEKSRIEDEQRREAAERGEGEWRPKLFKPAPKGDEENLDWIIDAEVDDQGPAEKQVEQILAIAPILPGQKAGGKLSQDEKSPSQQGKENTSSSSYSGKQQQQGDSGGDLIDFGQQDGTSAVPSQPTQKAQASSSESASRDLAAGMGGMSLQDGGKVQQQQQQPSFEEVKGNRPIIRMDSVGNEEHFVDAES